MYLVLSSLSLPSLYRGFPVRPGFKHTISLLDGDVFHLPPESEVFREQVNGKC